MENKKQPKTLVIGAGFGGIAAALRARALGHDVTLVDKMPQLGGRAQVFEKNGFKHDAGPTVLTAPFLFDEIFQLFGKKREHYIEFKSLDLWYRFLFHDGQTFDYAGSVENTLDQIEKFSPEDKQGYLSLLEESKQIYKVGFQELASTPFHQFWDMLKLAPKMIRLKSYRSVWQLVKSHLKSDQLAQAFSIQPLLVGGNPFDTTSIYNLIHFLEREHGIHFAMGGTGALVKALEKLMLEEGIKIHLRQSVEKLCVNNLGQITGAQCLDGRYFQADHIISNADPAFVYEKLLPQSKVKLSARLKTRYCEKSMGLFVLFFGTKKVYDNVAHHTISLGPRYQELLDDIFHKKILAEDFSLYLHRPTATDKSFAPEGCDSFYALVPVPNLSGGQNWKEIADRFQEKILENLEQTLLPDLRENLDHVFCKTPQDFSQDYLSPQGAGFSIAPLFHQSAWFRFHNQAEGPENLYFVGAGTHPGAGLPGVLSSAKVIENILKEKDQKEQKEHQPIKEKDMYAYL